MLKFLILELAVLILQFCLHTVKKRMNINFFLNELNCNTPTLLLLEIRFKLNTYRKDKDIHINSSFFLTYKEPIGIRHAPNISLVFGILHIWHLN